ncbi:MAG: hypothetical protein ABIO39_06605 [Caulobacteraceae bacterium]
MRMVSRVLVSLALAAAAPSLALAAEPTWSKGVVSCPGGIQTPLKMAPFTKPTAAQLSGACLAAQSRKALQPKPLMPTNQHPLSREEINRQAGPLVGAPR